jgi:hypothetical protein
MIEIHEARIERRGRVNGVEELLSCGRSTLPVGRGAVLRDLGFIGGVVVGGSLAGRCTDGLGASLARCCSRCVCIEQIEEGLRDTATLGVAGDERAALRFHLQRVTGSVEYSQESSRRIEVIGEQFLLAAREIRCAAQVTGALSGVGERRNCSSCFAAVADALSVCPVAGRLSVVPLGRRAVCDPAAVIGDYQRSRHFGRECLGGAWLDPGLVAYLDA